MKNSTHHMRGHVLAIEARYGRKVEAAARLSLLSCTDTHIYAHVRTCAKRTNLSPPSSCFDSLPCVSKMLPASPLKNKACQVSLSILSLLLVQLLSSQPEEIFVARDKSHE
ncbi:hypothetical protein DMN91_007777 [Ooceraea biroi]|uniref:Uncharacterized protein n=1 Tax=Ooceraea biroi TaxID=2015173 RepID=A0A3L8DFH7_OOCBI|nr:hypothetical protein DMN91_007777 [Ooceraea biroi]